MRQAAIAKLRAWSARRHGRDSLPLKINRRRIYILPTRFGIMLALMLVAMLIGGLNYNSNLGLAFAFLMVSVTLVTMHHCNRNLLGLTVDVTTEVDAFAGSEAGFEFVLQNDSNLDRGDIEIRCLNASGIREVPARSRESVLVAVPGPQRGSDAARPIRAAYALSLRLVSRLDLCARLLDRLCRSLPPRHPNSAGRPAAWDPASRSETRGDEGFRGPAGLRARRAPEAHGLEGAGARGGSRGSQLHQPGAQPEWLEWTSLEGQDTETRLSQLCLWVLESEAGAAQSMAFESPAGRFRRHAERRIVSPACGLLPPMELRSRRDRQTRDLWAAPGDLRLSGAGPGRARHLAARVGARHRGRLPAGIRLMLARRGRPAPPRGVRLAIAGFAIALLFVQFHTFNGLSAGTALLALVAGLKLLETDTQRDIYVITLIIYFVCVSAAAGGQLLPAARLPRRRLLADHGHAAASHRQPSGARLAPLPALCRTNAQSGNSAGAGALAAVSAFRLAALARTGRWAQCRIRP